MSRIPNTLIVITLLIVLSQFAGCDSKPNSSINPNTPSFGSFVSPTSGSSDLLNQVTFQWTCSDPDGDSLTYDLYLGDERYVALHTSNITDTFITIGGLKRGKVYYWYVTAKVDGRQQAKSRRTWFTTSINYMYPLNVGNYWSYDRFDALTDCANEYNEYYTDSTIITVSVVDDTRTYDGYTVFDLSETDGREYNGQPTSLISYYSNRPNGLYYLGGIGNSTPKQSSDILPVEFKGHKFRSIEELIYVFTGSLSQSPSTSLNAVQELFPLLTLKYPVRSGDQWNYRMAGNPWRMDKRITRQVTVRTEAGTFDCWEIQWLNDLDEDGEWDKEITFFDYISESGLIKRTIRFKGVSISDLNGSVLDVCTLMSNWELISYNIE